MNGVGWSPDVRDTDVWHYCLEGICEEYGNDMSRFLPNMLLGLSDDGYRSFKGADGTYGAGSGRAFRYTEEDVSRKGEDRGRIVGDISGMDWLDFEMSPLSCPLRMTYFGSASHRNIRTVAVERDYRGRVCRECGQPLVVCRGACGPREESRFLFDNTIRAFAEGYREVRDACDELGPELRSSGKDLGDISKDVALIVSTDETTQQVYSTRTSDTQSDGLGDSGHQLLQGKRSREYIFNL